MIRAAFFVMWPGFRIDGVPCRIVCPAAASLCRLPLPNSTHTVALVPQQNLTRKKNIRQFSGFDPEAGDDLAEKKVCRRGM